MPFPDQGGTRFSPSLCGAAVPFHPLVCGQTAAGIRSNLHASRFLDTPRALRISNSSVSMRSRTAFLFAFIVSPASPLRDNKFRIARYAAGNCGVFGVEPSDSAEYPRCSGDNHRRLVLDRNVAALLAPDFL